MFRQDFSFVLNDEAWDSIAADLVGFFELGPGFLRGWFRWFSLVMGSEVFT